MRTRGIRSADPSKTKNSTKSTRPEFESSPGLHWTPVRVAAEAAKLFVTTPGTRVLDVGCGPAKFCLVGASLTQGVFTGVEQREELVVAARNAAERMRLRDLNIIHGNLLDLTFRHYDAFYLYNPFEENMTRGNKIDATVPLSPLLFKRYNSYVAAQLGNMPIGTRVVTYAGYADEIPGCYDCELALFGDELKLWIKRREYEADIERARPSHLAKLPWSDRLDDTQTALI